MHFAHNNPQRMIPNISCSLAMAEMTTLLAAIYRDYTTSEYEKQKGVSPGITSRFEVFYDETLPKIKVSQNSETSRSKFNSISLQEHECWINFEKRR